MHLLDRDHRRDQRELHEQVDRDHHQRDHREGHHRRRRDGRHEAERQADHDTHRERAQQLRSDVGRDRLDPGSQRLAHRGIAAIGQEREQAQRADEAGDADRQQHRPVTGIMRSDLVERGLHRHRGILVTARGRNRGGRLGDEQRGGKGGQEEKQPRNRADGVLVGPDQPSRRGPGHAHVEFGVCHVLCVRSVGSQAK